MQGLEQKNMDNMLLCLEEMGYPFSQYALYKPDGNPKVLGHGGFSVVYEMTDRDNLDRHYAMKVLGMERHVVSSDAFWNTFRIQRILCDYTPYVMRTLTARELEVTMDEEGNISGVSDAKGERWTNDGLILQFILMEKLEDVIHKDKFGNAALRDTTLSTEDGVISFALQIGQAISVAHENKVLHRDIKLENIFRDEKEGCYKLGDFGVAKFVESGTAETVVYTEGYGAPEIERRWNDSYNATADIYSFGITLYLLLNDLRFPGSESYHVNRVQYDPQFTFPAPAHGSEEMSRLIRKMCSYHMEDRYQTIAQVLEELTAIREHRRQPGEGVSEYPDFETETYREEEQNHADQEDSSRKSIWEEYLEKRKTRAGRKEIERENDRAYRNASVRYLVLFSVLFLLLFKGLQTDSGFAGQWQFWIFPIAVLVEAVFARIREFDMVFGVITIGIGIYSALAVGLTVPHVFLFACVIFNIPSFTAGGALGTGLWILAEITGKLSWLSVLSDRGLGWVITVVLLQALYGILKLRRNYEKTTYLRAFLGVFLYDKIAIGMILGGIILLILQHSGKIIIPEMIQHMHLIRTGIISLAIYSFRNLWDDEGEAAEETAEQ